MHQTSDETAHNKRLKGGDERGNPEPECKADCDRNKYHGDSTHSEYQMFTALYRNPITYEPHEWTEENRCSNSDDRDRHPWNGTALDEFEKTQKRKRPHESEDKKLSLTG